jgi:hemerythrin-like domain-containing protein
VYEDVTRILDDLRQDHRNMALLLDLLERECDCIRDGSSTDYELIHDVMQYMTTYPDAVHHPKEDLIYKELKSVRPELAGGFERISLDHRCIAEQGQQLREIFACIDSEGAVRRNALVNDAMRYVNVLRSHMQWEEIDLFERCRAMALLGHQFVAYDDFKGPDDPLFGNRVHTKYDRLFKRIAAVSKKEGTTSRYSGQ